MEKKLNLVFLIFLLSLMSFFLTLCGCSHTVCRYYEGPERPLQEVAVLLTDLPSQVSLFGSYLGVNLVEIDGQPPCYETHLLPGQHSIKGIYHSHEIFYGKSTDTWGSSIVIRDTFKKGHVYIARGEVMGTTWRMDMKDLGTVEEVAPDMVKNCSGGPHWRKIMGK